MGGPSLGLLLPLQAPMCMETTLLLDSDGGAAMLAAVPAVVVATLVATAAERVAGRGRVPFSRPLGLSADAQVGAACCACR